MTLLEILRFEVDYRFRRPSTWIFLGAFIALAYWILTGMLVGEAERAGDLHANGPAAITMGNILVSMIGMVITAALFSGAALRDVETRMHPLFATSPITKTDYLFGRFTGALIVNVLLITVVPFALMLFTRPMFVEAALLGPFRAAAYLQPYVFFLLPNVFFTGALLFAVAVFTRRSLPVFGVGAFLFLAAMVVEEVGDQLGYGELAALIEPFGFSALGELWQFWTPHERNTRLMVFEGALLWNRLVILGVGVVILALTGWRFRMDTHHARARGGQAILPVDEARTGGIALPIEVRTGGIALPIDMRTGGIACPPRREAASFDTGTRLRQTLAIAGQSFRELVLSRDFLVIAIVLTILVVTLGANVLGDNFGVPFWPLTQFIAPFLGSFVPATAISLLIAFYAGELVHRERDAGLHDISDANPVPDWALFAGKFAALALMLVALQIVLMASGLLLQAAGGHFNFELGLYLKIVFGLKLIDYLLLAALAMLVHVVVDNKYFGHLLVVFWYLFTIFAGRLGIAHNMLVYGSDSGWVYSDVSKFGPFLEPVLWFKLYWAGWALLFAVLASLFWIRGRDRGLGKRLRLARLRFRRVAAMATIAAMVVVTIVGGYVFYNVNVLAGYRTADQAAEERAEYERRYGRYEDAAQPTVGGIRLHVEIYPERRVVDVRGTYALVNASAEPIGAVHLFLDPAVTNRAVSFDRTSRMTIRDDALGHRTYELAQPLQPGQSLAMTWDVRFEPRGFPNDDVNTSVVQNGTYFDHNGGRRTNHRRWLPLIGYQANRGLTAARARREHGLPPRPLAKGLDEPAGGHGSPGRETITFEAVIGTAANQIGVAPGTLRRSWTENGRRYFHYAMDKPVKNSFAIFSADYAVHEEKWKGVHIELFHHPAHTFNVERFARGVRASLDYYTANFGPYPHKQLRIAEFPRYANLAHAYPGTVSYAEAAGWVTRVDEKRHFDLPSMLVAHEVAHQWWGFQVMPAGVEGGPTVSEVLAQYSALMVIEKLYGKEMVERFLWNTRIEYLNRRGKPENAEVPLLRVTDHANLVYRKGPLAMYALRQFIGEEKVNAALRRMVEQYGSGQPPYATSRDLYRELKAAAPAEYHYLLEDFLATITLWDLRTFGVTAVPSGNGTWRVALDVEAHKLRADGSGKETEVPMNDFVDVGVYGASSDKPLYFAKHRVKSGRQRIEVVVKGEPAKAGIDPELYLIDRNWTDNTRPVPKRR